MNSDKKLSTVELREAFSVPLEIKNFKVDLEKPQCCESYIAASSNKSYIVVGSNDYIYVVQKDGSILFKVSTGEVITTVSMTEDSCLLVATGITGSLFVFYIPLQKLIWKQVLCKKSVKIVHCSLKEVIGTLSIFLHAENQVLFVLPNIILSDLYTAVTNDSVLETLNVSRIEELDLNILHPNHVFKPFYQCPGDNFYFAIEASLVEQFSYEEKTHEPSTEAFEDSSMDESRFGPNFTYQDSFFCLSPDDLTLQEACSSAATIELDSTKSVPMFLKLQDLLNTKKISMTTDNKYMLQLNKSGILSLMAVQTDRNVALNSWCLSENNEIIEDFVIKETINSESGVCTYRIGLLVGSSLKSEVKKFEIRDLNFKKLHSVGIPSNAEIVSLKPNQDYWYVINKDVDLIEPGNLLKSISVTVLYEVLPEEKILVLLNQKKFNDALKIASDFKLDIEAIYQVKIRETLSLFSSTGCLNISNSDSILIDLEKDLQHIKRPAFLNTCFELKFHEKYMKRIFECFKNWLMQNQSSNTMELSQKINEKMYKLVTLEKLGTILDANAFSQDIEKDMSSFMIQLLSEGHTTPAYIVWQRHKDDIIKSSNEAVQNILEALPRSIPSKLLIKLLSEDLLPFLAKRPEKIELLTNWLMHRLKMLSSSGEESWPHSGVKLVSASIQAIRDASQSDNFLLPSNTSLNIQKQAAYSVNQLTKWEELLEWLILLDSEFQCSIPFDVEICGDKLILTVLDSVKSDCIIPCIERFAKSYAVEKNIDLDKCFKQYVMTCCESFSWDSARSSSEERAVVITNYITSDALWEEAALELVSRASVPFADTVTGVLKKGLMSKNKRDFECMERIIGLKEILLKYEHTDFSLHLDVFSVSALLDFIFDKGRDSAVDDAVKVLESAGACNARFTAHWEYLQFCAKEQRLEEFYRVFENVPQEFAVKCAERLIRQVTHCLEDEFFLQFDIERFQDNLTIGKYLIMFFKQHKMNFDENIETLIKLQSHFGILMLLSKVSSKSERRKLLEEKISTFLASRTTSISTEEERIAIEMGVTEIYRLGYTLAFVREEIAGFLITHCLQVEKYDLVLEFCKEIISFPSLESADTAAKVVTHFYENFSHVSRGNFKPMVDVIHKLTSFAVAYCKPDSISNYLDLMRISSFLSAIRSTVEEEDSGLRFQDLTNDDPFSMQSFFPFCYNEGFQLDYGSLSTFLAKLLKMSNGQSEGMTDEFNRVVNHMNEKGQELLALRTLYLQSSNTSRCFESTEPENEHESHSELPSESSKNLSLRMQETSRFAVLRSLKRKKVDVFLNFHLLNIMPDNDQLKTLKLFKIHCNSVRRLALVGELGMQLGTKHKRSDIFNLCEAVYKKSILLSRLKMNSIAIGDIFKCDDKQSDLTILNQIITLGKMDLETAFESSSAFGLDADSVLVAYLKYLLLEADMLCHACHEPVTGVETRLKHIGAVFERIHKEELVYQALKKMKEQITPYSYEILIFIEERLATLSANIETIGSTTFEKELKLLNFLKVYERVGPISDTELKWWRKCHPTREFPPIASQRLPFFIFHLDEPSTLIEPELTAKTLPVWKTMPALHKLQPGDLVIMCAKNTTSKYLSDRSSPSVLLKNDDNFLDSITNIVETANPEEAVTCINYVCQRLPPGAVKVSLANMALQRATNLRNLGNNKLITKQVLSKLETVLRDASVEMELHRRNLASAGLLAMVSAPERLVEQLLRDAVSQTQCGDVYQAVLDIAQHSKIDVIEILLKSVFGWLNMNQNLNGNLDETFVNSPVLFEADDLGDENKDRIVHLLTNIPACLVPKLQQDISNNWNLIPFVQRVRLLQCLLSVYESPTVAQIIGCSTDELASNVISLWYSAELECLGFSIPFEMFARNNKTQVLCQVLKDTSRNPKILTFCIKMCLEFDIWDETIWKTILQRLGAAKAADYPLKDILDHCQDNLKHLWGSEVFINCYQRAISEVLKTHSDCQAVIEKLYKMLTRCPCVESLNFSSLVEHVKTAFSWTEQDIGTDINSLMQNIVNKMEQRSE